MLGPVSTGMGDCLWARKPFRYITQQVEVDAVIQWMPRNDQMRGFISDMMHFYC